MTATLLVVEDDDGIAAPLERALRREGYEVVRVTTGGDAAAHVAASPPDLIVLDLGLPDMDGLDVCRDVRDGGFDGPIMILTARGDELDRVVGLDSGADDYMAKPFGLAELLARVRSLLRRAVRPLPDAAGAADGVAAPAAPSAGGRDELLVGDLRIEPASRRVWAGGAEVQLTVKEFGLLALMAAEPGTVITRERIMDEVWDEHWFGSTKTLDVTLGRLRQKLTGAGSTVRIVAVRGVGFRVEPADA